MGCAREAKCAAALFSWSLPILLFCVYANARLDFTLAAAGGSSAKIFPKAPKCGAFSLRECLPERVLEFLCLRVCSDDAAVKFNWFQRAREIIKRRARCESFTATFQAFERVLSLTGVRINILNYCVQPFEAGSALQADKFYYLLLDGSPL